MKREQIPLYLTGAAAAATAVSVAAFEILMGLALLAVLVTPECRRRWRWPPILLPFLFWVSLTAASVLASEHALSSFSQLKKFYVYLMLFLVYAVIRRAKEIQWLAIVWVAATAASAAWSGVQLSGSFSGYAEYINARATGFMGHWMTFGGEMMMALLLIAAFALLSSRRSWPRGVSMGVFVLAGSLVTFGLLASYTRSMWLGALVGSVYVVWIWRRWMVLLIPVAASLILLANPLDVRQRAISAFRPQGDMDSNQFRVVAREIGWEMIKAHPWLGVGPGQVGPQHEQYIPASVSRPLPSGFYGHLHNVYIHYAAERGVPALLALLWLIGKALADFLRWLWRATADDELRWILHAAVAITLAVMVSGWYELNLSDSEVLGMFLAVMGCGYSALALSPAPRADKP